MRWKFHWLVVTTLGAAGIAVTSGCIEERGCTSDDECRQQRLCVKGRCVSPGGDDESDDATSADGGEDVEPDPDVDPDPDVEPDPDADGDVEPPPDGSWRPVLLANDSVEFESTPRGQTTDRIVNLKNGGEETLRIRNRELSHETSGDPAFEVSYPDPDQPDDPEQDRRPDSTDDIWPVDGVSAEIPPEGSMWVRITFGPTAGHAPGERVEASLSVESNDASNSPHVVSIVGPVEETDNACPTARARVKQGDAGEWLEAVGLEPEGRVVFDGSQSSDPDGSVEEFEWTILEQPSGSSASLTPSAEVVKPELSIDATGEYRIGLRVYDDEGTPNCDGDMATAEVYARSPNELRVELVWETPKDDDPDDTNGSDMDLHYRHPKASAWNEEPWDIFWHNDEAEWGEGDVHAGDPVMTLDDTDGQGPEIVEHSRPDDGKQYAVGVYYYDDSGFGPSDATIKIYAGDNLEHEIGPKRLAETFKFWFVGYVEWPSGDFLRRDEVTTGFPSE